MTISALEQMFGTTGSTIQTRLQAFTIGKVQMSLLREGIPTEETSDVVADCNTLLHCMTDSPALAVRLAHDRFCQWYRALSQEDQQILSHVLSYRIVWNKFGANFPQLEAQYMQARTNALANMTKPKRAEELLLTLEEAMTAMCSMVIPQRFVGDTVSIYQEETSKILDQFLQEEIPRETIASTCLLLQPISV